MPKTKLTKEQPKVSEIYYSHYSKFVRNTENLRSSVERQNLLNQIKADLGVKIPGYVYPESRNIEDPETGESRMLIFEMNSRHWVLEQLANDPEYLSAGGSLELPYMVLPEDYLDPVKEIMFMLSLGTTNEQLNPLEIGKAYIRAFEAGIKKGKAEIENFEELSEAEQAAKIKKIKTKVIKQIMEESGKSENDVYKIFRVMEAGNSNENLQSALEKGAVTVSSADEVIKVSKSLGVEPDKVLAIAQRVTSATGKNRTSDADVQKAALVLKHPELTDYVERGVINPIHSEAVLETAKKLKADLESVITNTLELGEVNPQNLNRVKEFYSDEPLPDKEEVEEEEEKVKSEKPKNKIRVTKEDLVKAIEQCESFLLNLSNLADDFSQLPQEKLIILGDKLEALDGFLVKNIKN